MQSLPFAFTQAPNIDAFESPIEKGYGAGFAQMSDAVKRMQQKRQLDQGDIQLTLQRREQDIAVWRTQVEASLRRQAMAQASQQHAQNYALEAQNQAFQMEVVNATMPLKQQGLQLSNQQTMLEMQKMQQDISRVADSASLAGNITKRDVGGGGDYVSQVDAETKKSAPVSSAEQNRDTPQRAIQQKQLESQQTMSAFSGQQQSKVFSQPAKNPNVLSEPDDDFIPITPPKLQPITL